jgi:hypothetical protein
MKTMFMLLATLAVACGGKAADDTIPPAPAPAASAPEAPAAGSAIDRFHDKLAPLWHADESPERIADTCGAVADLHGIAQEILTAGPPAGAAADFADAAQALEQSVGALHGECDTAERKDFQAKFTVVHDAFHAVADKSGSAH